MWWGVMKDRSEGRECGYFSNDRRRVVLRVVTADGPWWARLFCRLFWHQVACCADHATYVYRPRPQGDLRAPVMVGVLCERCGALLEMPF